jgi:hypothetical protein
MPEFILNNELVPGGKKKLYNDLDGFAKGYIEAMFFTNCDSGHDDEHIANKLGVDRLTIQSIHHIKRQCADFQIAAEALLDLAYEQAYEEAQAGRDFWFTRQGHGVGFWDRDELDVDIGAGENLGKELSKAADKFGEANCYIYRGWINHD